MVELHPGWWSWHGLPPTFHYDLVGRSPHSYSMASSVVACSRYGSPRPASRGCGLREERHTDGGVREEAAHMRGSPRAAALLRHVVGIPCNQRFVVTKCCSRTLLGCRPSAMTTEAMLSSIGSLCLGFPSDFSPFLTESWSFSANLGVVPVLLAAFHRLVPGLHRVAAGMMNLATATGFFQLVPQ